MTSINHRIKKHIIDQLSSVKFARFTDIRPPETDTNLFSYHLKSLVGDGLVLKTDKGYSLSVAGMELVNKDSVVASETAFRPRILLMFVVQNSSGDILLQRRQEQPFINSWSLPYGELRKEDDSLMEAAQRQISERMGVSVSSLVHAGDCYIRTRSNDSRIVNMAHIFRFNSDYIRTSVDLRWARPHKLSLLELAPAVEKIMARTFFQDPFYFEEYNVDGPESAS